MGVSVAWQAMGKSPEIQKERESLTLCKLSLLLLIRISF